MNWRARLASPVPYLAWGGASALGLGLACWIDPWVFAFAALGAMWVCGGLALAALLFAPRALGWALVAALPTAVAVVVLGTYRWA